MQVISNGEVLTVTLTNLLNKHNHIQFAVAWANCTNYVYKQILKQEAKILKSVIGYNSYITAPQVLVDYTESKKVKFLLETNGIFHPKIYIFSSEKSWDIIIGSANMTNGGLGNNTELMFHISSNDTDRRFFVKASEQLEKYWNRAKSISIKEASNYANLYKLNKPKPASTSLSKNSKQYIETNIIPMPWADFFKKVKNDPHHGFNNRCNLLADIKKAFVEYVEFKKMPLGQRKMIAGLPTDFHEHWEEFGSMKEAGYFHKAVNENSQYLSDGLNYISRTGAVSKKDYLKYKAECDKAFPNGGFGIGSATRLLAMKRPDMFVCLDGANKEALCKDFGTTASTLTYEKYWDEIIVRIMDSVWWNQKKPNKKTQRKVWKARAAMLDVIYYEPKKKNYGDKKITVTHLRVTTTELGLKTPLKLHL